MSATIKAAIEALKSRIADAYTAVSNKGGTLPATQDSANLPTAIASIPSGGGSEEPEEKDFLLIDYDGKILHSYTAAELAALAEFPAPPTHEGLTFVRWTNSLAELKSSTKRQVTISGAMYKPTDNKCHYFIYVPFANTTFSYSSTYITSEVEWGDGVVETLTSGTKSHQYSSAGYYEIKEKRTSGSYGAGFYISDAASKTMVQHLWFDGSQTGSSISATRQELYPLVNLKSIVAPAGYVLASGNDVFRGCMNLGAIVTDMPGGVHRVYHQSGVKYITTISSSSGQNWCSQNSRLKRVNISNRFTTQASNTCLQYISIPSGTTGINQWDPVSGVSSCREIHLLADSVINLASTSYFSGMPSYCKIYVKTGLKSSYETATNWSTIYAQYEFIEED